MKGKLKYPFQLSLFTYFLPEEEDGPDSKGRAATADETAKVAAFQEGMATRLGPADNVLILGRCWHLGVVQLEYRVADPELANQALQAIIDAKANEFPFEYRMFPDGRWEIPRSLWTGELIAGQAEAGEAEDETDLDDESDDGTDEDEDEDEGEGAEDEEEEGEEALEDLQARLNDTTGDDRIVLWYRIAPLLDELDEAEALLKAGLVEYPENASLLRMLGLIHIRQRKLDEGRVALLKSIELEELSSMAHYNLACLEALAGRPDDAMVALKNALLIEPFKAFDACGDDDFESLREREDFQKIASPQLCIGSRSAENEHAETLLIVMPGSMGPMERGELYEDPLGAFLDEREAGTVLGGNTSLSTGEAEGETTIEIGTDDVEATISAIQEFFATAEVKPPPGTRLYPGAQVGVIRDPATAVAL
ncbi:hypothetical protein DB346_05705 [Verrucomicrobia bacterium LW23]|nr:hypothetical protein DB346_05705 [Verrucomicrobia bacterium LW23]